MHRLIVLLASLAVASSRPFTSINDVPEQYRSMVPKEAVDFLAGLTQQDKIALKDWAKGHTGYRNEHEAIQALKLRSPALGEKAEKLYRLIKEKVASLKPEAKAFASEVIDRLQRLQAQIVAGEKPSLDDLKAKAALGLKKYNALSEAAKADIEDKFPIINAIMSNDKFKKLAESYVGPAN